MAKEANDFSVDIRALKLNMERGAITEKEYKNYLKSLPDLKDQLEEVPAYEEPNDDEFGTNSNDLTFSVE